jgi:hypothetical protein
MPQKRGINAVKALHHQAGRDVPIGDDSVPRFELCPDLRLKVVVPIGGVQAG